MPLFSEKTQNQCLAAKRAEEVLTESPFVFIVSRLARGGHGQVNMEELLLDSQ